MSGVNPDDVENDVGNIWRTLYKMERNFSENPNPLKMASKVRSTLEHRAAACDVKGVWLPLILMLQSCIFFGSPSNPNLQYGHFEPYHWFYKNVQNFL